MRKRLEVDGREKEIRGGMEEKWKGKHIRRGNRTSGEKEGKEKEGKEECGKA